MMWAERDKYLMERFVNIPWKKHVLYGILHETDVLSDKLVLFVHGIPGDRVDSKRLPVRIARCLSEYNISSLRVDLYASGVSEGEFGNVSLTDQKEQVESVVNYIKSYLCFKGKVILLAFSEAAKIVNSIAAENSEIAGVCYCNGIFAREIIADCLRVRRFYRRNGNFVANIGFGVWLNSRIISEIDQWSLCSGKDLAKVKSLFIYGSEDDLTQNSRQLVQQEKNDFYQYEIIEGADHLFTQNLFEKKIILILKTWILNTNF